MQISRDELHKEALGLCSLVLLAAAHLKEDGQGGGRILQDSQMSEGRFGILLR